MDKKRILFLCVHNSARSQIAEAFLKREASDIFDVTSAGLEPGTLNPDVITVMKETGIDISGNSTKSVFDMYTQGITFSYVITVCDRKAADRCPVFPGITTRLHWPFDDPSAFTGQPDALERTRQVRDSIEEKIKDFVSRIRSGEPVDEEDKFILDKRFIQ
jgi:arsenate reductase